MERVFANLYRMGSPNRRGMSYTYFLKRKQGNLLVCHQTAPTAEDLEEIEAMGGVESQWVCHSHDVIKGPVHGQIHKRFGAPLYYHAIDRSRVRNKSKCPAEIFDGDGTAHGDDFEALFLPTCTAGHSIYRWKSGGRYYLFTAHAIYYEGGEWLLQFNPHNDWHTRVGPLAKQRVDYLFPGYAPADEEGFYRLSDKMRTSLSRALRKKATPLPKPPSVELAGPTSGLKLDGKLSAAWKRLRPVTFVDRQGEPPAHKTTCRMAWDAEHLWFCFENEEPEMAKLTARATERDSRNPPIWDDDAVEIFIAPDAKDRRLCYQFIINANGAILDGKHKDSTSPRPDFRWRSAVEAVVARQKSKWIVQARIPLADVGIASPPAGTRIALNLYRDRVCGGDTTFSEWSPTGPRLHLTPDRFGVVTFARAV